MNVYDVPMKFVLLAMFVLFAAQPSQAVSCDMSGIPDTGHGQHSNMPDVSMDHDDMQDMDCCDEEPADSGHDCSSYSHCGACAASFTALNPSALETLLSSSPRVFLPLAQGILHRAQSPPFRPPIA